ncbi:hypothetical protein ACOMHN_028862 [Nucella lapillus]
MVNFKNDTHPEPSSPFVGESIPIAARAVLCTLGTLMILCGVTGSGLLATVIFRRFRRKRHVHDLLLASLTLADLLNLGYWLTFLVLDLILGYHPVVNQSHCVANAMIACTLNIVCISSLVSISLNRYLHVCHSQLCQRFFTLPRTLGILATIWTVAMLLALPPVLGIGGEVYEYSTFSHVCVFKRQNFSYSKAGTIFSTSVPMLFIGFCNFSIFRFWRKARVSLDKWKREGGQEVRRQGECVGGSRETGLAESAKSDGEIGDLAPNSQQDGPVVCVHALSETDDSELNDSEIKSVAGDSVESDGDTESHSQIMPTLDHDVKAGNEGGVTITVSCPEEESCCPRQREDGQGPDQDKATRAHDNTKLTLLTVPGRSAKSSKKGPARARKRQSTVLPDASPSNSPAVSLKKTGRPRSVLNQPKQIVAKVIRNVQLKTTAQTAREVAFVRSLFIVFLLTFIAFVPFTIITVVSINTALPSEVNILGLLILYVNNSVNWIVYGVMNPSFRKAYSQCGQQLLGMCRQPRAERTDRQHTYSMSSVTPSTVHRGPAQTAQGRHTSFGDPSDPDLSSSVSAAS